MVAPVGNCSDIQGRDAVGRVVPTAVTIGVRLRMHKADQKVFRAQVVEIAADQLRAVILNQEAAPYEFFDR